MLKFVLRKDPEIEKLVKKTDKKILARWAIDCAERAMPFFEEVSADKRPRKAIETLQKWIKTGKFRMPEIRKASLGAHAAAREIGEDNAAKSAARAAGQAVATAHVKTHAMGAGLYAQQAIFRATGYEKAVKKEREWQLKRLKKLRVQCL